MSNAKIRIKLGEIEIDYEGEASFLQGDLLKLIDDLHKLEPKTSKADRHGKADPSHKLPVGQMTTKNIATKLNAQSGSQLAKAAIAHLVIMKSLETVKRPDILKEMKSATGVYKSSMESNFGKIMGALVSDNTVVETDGGVFALKPNVEAELRAKLSG